MEPFFVAIDPVLIFFYRLIPDPVSGYFLGTFILALLAVAAGQFSVSLAIRINQQHVRGLNEQLVHWNDFSVQAVESGDSEAYHKYNHRANQVFGRIFFTNIAYSAGMLWPVPFMLSWMNYRFGRVDFPLPGKIPGLGESVGYTFIFILLYILAYICFKPIKKYLPFIRKTEAIRKEGSDQYKKMRSLADVLEKRMKAHSVQKSSPPRFGAGSEKLDKQNGKHQIHDSGAD